MNFIATILLLTVGVSPLAAQALVVEYDHLDALGSVRVVTDQHQNVLERHDCLPFGEEYTTPTFESSLRFTGKEPDAETPLDYVGARYYASGTGRFTTVDPALNIDAALTDPQRWNRYVYARNNPPVFIDPDGRELYRIIIPYERELMRLAGAIRDRLASALGADATGPQHPLATFGRNVVDSLLATVLPRDVGEAAGASNAAFLGLAPPLESGAASAVARLKTQENRLKIRGPWDGGTIELWLHTEPPKRSKLPTRSNDRARAVFDQM